MRRFLPPVLVAAAFTVACSDQLGPSGEHLRPVAAIAVDQQAGITLDQQNGSLGEGDTTVLAKGFNPRNPHHGDAIVAVIFWQGANTIVSVNDFISDVQQTPVGNTFHLVETVSQGGVSMAMYVATNIQGYPDPNPDPSVVYAVKATFSQRVVDGGLMLSAYSGVAPAFTDALGGHSSGAGAGSAATVSDAGPIPIDAGSLAHAVTMANAMVGRDPPAGYGRITTLSDAVMVTEEDTMTAATTGTTDPRWNWGGPFPSTNTWLASVVALKPGAATVNQPPVAAFTSSCSSLTCAFTSTSSDPDGTISSYNWNFGDGQNSNLQNPSHLYAAAGSYTVTLTVTDNANATNSVQHGVTVSQANQSPTAAFTSSCTNLTCNFTNQSSDPDGTIASSSWTFGDGQTSTASNPSHIYGAAGSYTVTLTVTDDRGGTNSVQHGVTVSQANQSPTAAFTSSCTNLTCNFTNQSSDPDGTIASSSWTFGDGQTSTASNPSHIYGAAGSYTVTLTVTDDRGGTNSVQHGVTVSQANQSPTAAFSSSCSGDACTFTNTSSDPDGTIASSSWNFGDGQTSSAASPSHTYSASGTYTVQLTVTDDRGGTNAVSHTVTVNRPPVAAFTSSCSNLSCNFTSQSSDPDGSISNYSWNFGDNQTSAAQNPSHSYSAGGTYTVTLTVTDNRNATNSVQHNVTVSVPNQPPVAAFSSSCSGLGCNFTSTSSDPDGSISAYSWTFGDGGVSSAQNPGHTYAAGGTYTVTLKVTDNRGGTNTVSHNVTVTAPNTAPVVNAGPDQTVLLGVLYSLNASFSDPDNGPWTYTINWGDGTSSSGSRSTQGSFSAGHTYLGILTTRTITVTVTDSRGASGSDTKRITLIL